jgi:hypothetical protein
LEGRIQGSSPVRIQCYGPTKERIKQALDVGSEGSNVAPHWFANRRGFDVLASGPESKNGAGKITLGQSFQRGPAMLDVINNDGQHRLARGGFDRGIPAIVNGDKIQQGAQNPRCTDQSIGTSRTPCRVEGLAQGISRCLPATGCAVSGATSFDS